MLYTPHFKQLIGLVSKIVLTSLFAPLITYLALSSSYINFGSLKWVDTPCRIENHELEVLNKSRNRFRETATVSYAYEEKFYSSQITERVYSANTPQEKALQELRNEPGTTKRCLINPNNPAEFQMNSTPERGLQILFFGLFGSLAVVLSHFPNLRYLWFLTKLRVPKDYSLTLAQCSNAQRLRPANFIASWFLCLTLFLLIIALREFRRQQSISLSHDWQKHHCEVIYRAPIDQKSRKKLPAIVYSYTYEGENYRNSELTPYGIADHISDAKFDSHSVGQWTECWINPKYPYLSSLFTLHKSASSGWYHRALILSALFFVISILVLHFHLFPVYILSFHDSRDILQKNRGSWFPLKLYRKKIFAGGYRLSSASSSLRILSYPITLVLLGVPLFLLSWMGTDRLQSSAIRVGVSIVASVCILHVLLELKKRLGKHNFRFRGKPISVVTFPNGAPQVGGNFVAQWELALKRDFTFCTLRMELVAIEQANRYFTISHTDPYYCHLTHSELQSEGITQRQILSVDVGSVSSCAPSGFSGEFTAKIPPDAPHTIFTAHYSVFWVLNIFVTKDGSEKLLSSLNIEVLPCKGQS